MDRRAITVLLGGLLLAPALATGCSSASTPSPTPTRHAAAPAPQLSASTTQMRIAEGTRALRTGVVNHSAHPVTVTSATLDWPGFTRQVVRVGQRIGPGQIAAFDMAYGDPRCTSLLPRGRPSASRPASRPPSPRLEVVVDGVRRVVPLHVDITGLLHQLWLHECADQRLAQAASLRFERGHPVPAGYLAVLQLRRRASGVPGRARVRVTGFSGSVILELLPRVAPGARPSAPMPASLPTGPGAVLRIPVLVRPGSRCDPHSLGQSQQTFLLSAIVRVGQHPPQRAILPVGSALHRALQATIDRLCT